MNLISFYFDTVPLNATIKQRREVATNLINNHKAFYFHSGENEDKIKTAITNYNYFRNFDIYDISGKKVEIDRNSCYLIYSKSYSSYVNSIKSNCKKIIIADNQKITHFFDKVFYSNDPILFDINLHYYKEYAVESLIFKVDNQERADLLLKKYYDKYGLNFEETTIKYNAVHDSNEYFVKYHSTQFIIIILVNFICLIIYNSIYKNGIDVAVSIILVAKTLLTIYFSIFIALKKNTCDIVKENLTNEN
jgi:hypothetical protein